MLDTMQNTELYMVKIEITFLNNLLSGLKPIHRTVRIPIDAFVKTALPSARRYAPQWTFSRRPFDVLELE